MNFNACIRHCANGQNPDGLKWLGLSGSCVDSRDCVGNRFCDVCDEEGEPIPLGWCQNCPGTTAEDCKRALSEFGDFEMNMGFNECINVCANGENPNGVQHNPDDYNGDFGECDEHWIP